MTAAHEEVWQAMAFFPLRRAMLGRQRCDAVVDAALAEAPLLTEARFSGHDSAALRERWEQRVRLTFRDRAGSPLLSMLLFWAISKVVEILVTRWWEQRP